MSMAMWTRLQETAETTVTRHNKLRPGIQPMRDTVFGSAIMPAPPALLAEAKDFESFSVTERFRPL